MLAIIKQWGKRGSLSILDQGLFSGANFCANLLLARWLVPKHYGAFAVAFSLYLFLAGTINSLTLEPMMVFGATDFKTQTRSYLKRVLASHLVGSTVLALPYGLFAWHMTGLHRETLLSAAVALPFMLLIWCSRRLFYITTRIAHAVCVSALYAVCLLGGLTALHVHNALTLPYVYLTFSLASIVCALLSLWLLERARFQKTTPPPFRHILKKHWHYGKWLIPASIAAGVSTLLFTPLLGFLSSLEDAAAYKAVQNLILPFTQILVSFGLLLLPFTAATVRDAQPHDVLRKTKRMIMAFLLFAAVYGGALILMGQTAMRYLYANPFYMDYTWLLIVFAGLLLLKAINQALGILMRAYEATSVILKAKLVSAAMVLALGFYAIPTMKLQGVMLCMTAGVVGELLVLVLSYRKRILKDRG